MNLNQFLEIIRNMEPMPGREFKPHRYLALLATLDIIENQEEPQKEIYYNDDFKKYFSHYFNIYCGPNDRNRPFKPFFHLKNAGRNLGEFWFLSPRPGRKADLNNMRGGFSERELRENVEYAEIHKNIFNLLKNQESREIVRKEIEKCLRTGLKT